MSEHVILRNDQEEDVALLLLHDELGVFYRDAGEWVPLFEDEDALPFDLESLTAVDAGDVSLKEWDKDSKSLL